MATRKSTAKKPEPKAEPEVEEKPVKKAPPPSTVDKLLGMQDEVHMAALTADSDIIRTHLNNIDSAIGSLQSALDQVAAWDRNGPVRTDG